MMIFTDFFEIQVNYLKLSFPVFFFRSLGMLFIVSAICLVRVDRERENLLTRIFYLRTLQKSQFFKLGKQNWSQIKELEINWLAICSMTLSVNSELRYRNLCL